MIAVVVPIYAIITMNLHQFVFPITGLYLLLLKILKGHMWRKNLINVICHNLIEGILQSLEKMTLHLHTVWMEISGNLRLVST